MKNFEFFPRNWKSNLVRFSVPGLMLAGKDHLKFIFSLRITGPGRKGSADYGNVKKRRRQNQA